jgi:hypothetical protein
MQSERKMAVTDFSRIYSAGGDEINATPINREQATQRREGAKRIKPDQSCSLNSDRSQPARETFFPCVFAPLRLCVEILLNNYGFSHRIPTGARPGLCGGSRHLNVPACTKRKPIRSATSG